MAMIEVDGAMCEQVGNTLRREYLHVVVHCSDIRMGKICNQGADSFAYDALELLFCSGCRNTLSDRCYPCVLCQHFHCILPSCCFGSLQKDFREELSLIPGKSCDKMRDRHHHINVIAIQIRHC